MMAAVLSEQLGDISLCRCCSFGEIVGTSQFTNALAGWNAAGRLPTAHDARQKS